MERITERLHEIGKGGGKGGGRRGRASATINATAHRHHQQQAKLRVEAKIKALEADLEQLRVRRKDLDERAAIGITGPDKA